MGVPIEVSQGSLRCVLAPWNQLNEILRQEGELAAVILVCVGKDSSMRLLCHPSLDAKDVDELLDQLREGPVAA